MNDENIRIIKQLEDEYNKLSREIKEPLNNWVRSIKHTKDRYNNKYTISSIVRTFEALSPEIVGKLCCISADQMKYAMYINDFKPDSLIVNEWVFKIDDEQDFEWK
jgi:hypothetical protein